jgi:hypothetical protein
VRARVRVGVLQVDTHHARACGADEGVEVEDDVLVAAAVAVEAAAVLWLPLVILEDLVVPVRSGSGWTRIGVGVLVLDGDAEVRGGWSWGRVCC